MELAFGVAGLGWEALAADEADGARHITIDRPGGGTGRPRPAVRLTGREQASGRNGSQTARAPFGIEPGSDDQLATGFQTRNGWLLMARWLAPATQTTCCQHSRSGATRRDDSDETLVPAVNVPRRDEAESESDRRAGKVQGRVPAGGPPGNARPGRAKAPALNFPVLNAGPNQSCLRAASSDITSPQGQHPPAQIQADHHPVADR